MLTEKGSLTGLIGRVMGRAPVLNCLSQGKAFANSMERELLQTESRVYSHIREITMGTNQQTWLFARSVIPLATLKGSARRLTNIGNMPLGKILFGRAHNAVRREMQVELINPPISLRDTFFIPEDFLLWQRRSIFELDSGPLMISEIFLPDSPVYLTVD